MTIYTDGSCVGNPGPGGYGVVLNHDEHRRELSAGFRRTTNNRMELLAAITGLETLKQPCAVTLFSDSKYLVDGMVKRWARRWKARGWRKSDGNPALNWDLWDRLLRQCDRHQVRFSWVRGHAGHAENERCDKLANDAARGARLRSDDGYENPPRRPTGQQPG